MWRFCIDLTMGWRGTLSPFYWEGDYHLFSIKSYGEGGEDGTGKPWFHLVTRDCVTFEDWGEAVAYGSADAEDFHVGTGSVIAGKGILYLYYTGINPAFAGTGKAAQGQWACPQPGLHRLGRQLRSGELGRAAAAVCAGRGLGPPLPRSVSSRRLVVPGLRRFQGVDCHPLPHGARPGGGSGCRQRTTRSTGWPTARPRQRRTKRFGFFLAGCQRAAERGTTATGHGEAIWSYTRSRRVRTAPLPFAYPKRSPVPSATRSRWRRGPFWANGTFRAAAPRHLRSAATP